MVTVKIISLNTWHSQLRDELRAYIVQHRDDTDVFCFQEASEQDREAYSDLLDEHYALFPVRRLENDGSTYSNATYVRKGLAVVEHGNLFTVGADNPYEVGIAGFVTVQLPTAQLTICNVHGIPLPGDKLDSPGRLYQSQTLLQAFQGRERSVIIGDFNMMPETGSIQLFSRHGYQDLIKNYAIKSTRNQITFDRFPDNIQHYADYAFVSPSIPVNSFLVPTQIVSDHQPLELEIEI